MWQAGWCSLAIAMAAAATTAMAATVDGSSSDENLRQALVLVDILKSGILQRSRTAPPTSSYADYGPWPPPYRSLLFHRYDGYGGKPTRLASLPSYGMPFRRMVDMGKGARRKGNNATRQMEYDDPFGPHPGGDEHIAPEEVAKGSTNPTTGNTPTINTTRTVAKNMIETTGAETKKRLDIELTTTSALKERPAVTKAEETIKTLGTLKTAINTKTAATPKVNENTKTSGIQITSNTEKTSVITSTATNTKDKIKKTINVVTKSKTKNTEDPQATSKHKSPRVKAGGIVKLNYKKGSNTSKGHIEKLEDPEIVQAALELQREAADTGDLVRNRCPTRSTAPRTGLVASCSGRTICNEGNDISTSPRYKATTRVHLSRSSRPPVPLPANNAFCYTNPESALCRTFI